MQRLTRYVPSAAVGMAGFVLGVYAATPFAEVPAQAPAAVEPAPETNVEMSQQNAERIKQATDALTIAQSALQQEGLYVEAIKGLNPYATLSGGVDAVTDLEEGRGVDPVTFAGLHIGLAADEIVPHLDKDAKGRLTYKGKLVRIYPVDRMEVMNARHAAILKITEGGTRSATSGK
jgi:hypothetical protein